MKRWATLRRLVFALAVLPFAVGCGADFEPTGAPPAQGSDPAPLAAYYDILIFVSGFTIDATLAIDPRGPGASTAFTGTVTVRSVESPGGSLPFTPISPLAVAGTVTSTQWRLDPFGPIEVDDPGSGTILLVPALDGLLAIDGRSIAGTATETSASGTGSFDAVKQRRYLVASTDFGVTGTVSLITVRYATFPARREILVERDLEAISGDPVARTTDGDALVINRFFFDNVQVLDPAAGFRTALQFSTGNGSNPHDAIAVDASRLFITRYEPPWNDILIAERATGSDAGRIDLSSLATNSSGTPRADGMALAEGRLFVGLQNINGAFTEYGLGRVAVIDPVTGVVVRALTMNGKNPFGPPVVHPLTGDLYWAMAGTFRGGLAQELSGGVEVIDPRTLTVLGMRVDDDALGGNVSSVALAETLAAPGTGFPAVIGYCVVTTPAGQNIVRTFDPDTGTVYAGAVWQSASFLPEVVSDGDGWILIVEHDITTPRVLIVSAATGALIAAPQLSLPPFSVAVLTRHVTGV